MGLFDSLLNGAKEIIDGSKKAIENIQSDMDQEINNSGSVGYEQANDPSEPLPAVMVQTQLHENIVQFMLSGDFTDHSGYANSAISLKYNPEHLSGLDNIEDENDITISLLEGVGEFLEIADCIEEYISSGTLDAEQFEAFHDGKYMFKAKISSSYEEYFYVLRSDAADTYDHDILLLLYPTDIQNTNLEKKLIACLDEAANTLRI